MTIEELTPAFSIRNFRFNFKTSANRMLQSNCARPFDIHGGRKNLSGDRPKMNMCRLTPFDLMVCLDNYFMISRI